MSIMLWSEDLQSMKMELEGLESCLSGVSKSTCLFWKPNGTRFQAELPDGLIFQCSAVQGYIWWSWACLLFRFLSSTKLVKICTIDSIGIQIWTVALPNEGVTCIWIFKPVYFHLGPQDGLVCLSPYPPPPPESFYIHLVAPGMTGSSILETIIAVAANFMSCENLQPTHLQNMQSCGGKRLFVWGWCWDHCLKVSAVQSEKVSELGVPTWKGRLNRPTLDLGLFWTLS